MISRQKAGKQFVTVEAEQHLLRPIPVFDNSTHLAMYTAKGKILIVDLAEVKSLAGGGRGTQLMTLDASDSLAQIIPVGEGGIIVSGIYRNKQTEDTLSLQALAEYIGKRAARDACSWCA